MKNRIEVALLWHACLNSDRKNTTRVEILANICTCHYLANLFPFSNISSTVSAWGSGPRPSGAHKCSDLRVCLHSSIVSVLGPAARSGPSRPERESAPNQCFLSFWDTFLAGPSAARSGPRPSGAQKCSKTMFL